MTDRDLLVPTLREYVLDVGERAAKTFLQALLGAYVAANVTSVVHFDWVHALDFAAAATVLSVLTSLASPLTGSTTASLTKLLVPRSSHELIVRQAEWDAYTPDPEPSAPAPAPPAPEPSGATAVSHAEHQPEQSLPERWDADLQQFLHKLHHQDDTQEAPRVAALPYIRHPRSSTKPLTALQVATAYGYDKIPGTGNGATIAYIELGGGFTQSDLTAYLRSVGLADVRADVRTVDGAKSSPDGVNGADGEVMLDVEVGASIAPGATHVVVFGPNTDQGFYDAIALAGEIADIISISWGGPENAWAESTMHDYDALFADLAAKGVRVTAASGDTGSQDSGGKGAHVDFPASSPHVLACGGTRLTINADGSRAAEVTWDDNDTTSATGGGKSTVWDRDVPDVAGNADPYTGYPVQVDGQQIVVGGTSAVAPLYAGLLARLHEVVGAAPDLVALIGSDPTICYDVTAGDNGAFRAGPGRDKVTGFGVVDGGRALAAAQAQQPAPPVAPPAAGLPQDVIDLARRIIGEKRYSQRDKAAARDLLAAAGIAA